MAEVGTYYITVMPEMSKFTNSVTSALSGVGTTGGNKFVSSFGEILKGSAVGTMLGNFASKVGGTIMSGFSAGISRIDTIQNFPRVMEALGFSADDAATSISHISERLDGLPSSTDSVVALTQAIADSTSDLGLATDAALGFNDMLLASGASVAEVTTATGVFNRILGKGNATTAQWMSLQSVMPAQLSAVAKEMLGEGASAEELRDALNDGTVSWEDFLRAIVKLDSDGTASMASFYDQAVANSDGIGTAIENVGNRVARGWESIFDAIGRSNISGAINTMSYGIKDAMVGVAGGIRYLREQIADTSIGENIAHIGEAIGNAFSGLWNNGGPEMLKGLADALVGLIDGALQWVADHGDLVAAGMGAITGALVTMASWDLGIKLAGIPGALTGIWTALSANPIMSIVVLFSSLVLGIYTWITTTEEGQAAWEAFTGALSGLWSGLQEDWGVLVGVLQQEWQSFQDFINGIPEWWSGVCSYWSTSWDEFKGIMSTSLTELGDNWNRSIEDMRNSAARKFEDIKKGITDKIDAAKNAVHDAIEAIKGFFNFSWKLPTLKLPHISISGSFSLNPPSVPHFGISWYAKGNGIFAPNSPRIIGVGDNRTEYEYLNTESQLLGIVSSAVRMAGGGNRGGDVIVSGNTFVIREEADIDRIAERLSVKWQREMGGALA